MSTKLITDRMRSTTTYHAQQFGATNNNRQCSNLLIVLLKGNITELCKTKQTELKPEQ
jgi:hypothetical protein